MTPLPKKLAEIRDAKAEKYIDDLTQGFYIGDLFIPDTSSDEMKAIHKKRFMDGFDSCYAELKPVIEKLISIANNSNIGLRIAGHRNVIGEADLKDLTDWISDEK